MSPQQPAPQPIPQAIDEDALAKANGALSSQSVDEDALAKANGAVDSTQAQPRTWLDSVADYAKGAWSQINPVSAAKGVAQAVSHPIDAATQMLQNQGALADKAKAAFQSGDYLTGLRHSLDYLLPVIGPSIDAMGDQAQGGQVASALGKATGFAVPVAIGVRSAVLPSAPASAAAPLTPGTGGILDAAAQKLTRGALKGGYTIGTDAGDVDAAARTMREGGIPLSPEGAAKIQGALGDLRQVIADKARAAAQTGITIDPKAVMQRLDEAYNRYGMQVNPDQDLRDISKVADNFTANNPGPIPADQAQAMKVGSNILNASKYGKVSTAQVEAEKALTRGIKEELEAQIPELGSLNAQQAKLMNLDGILGPAVNKYLNSTGFIGDLKTTDPTSAAIRAVLANPVVKARAARMIDMARGNPGQVAGSAGTGASRVGALIAGLQPQQQQ